MNRRRYSSRRVALPPQQPLAEPLPPSRPWKRAWVWPSRESGYWLLAISLLLWQGWQRGVNLVALLACFLLALWMLNALFVFFRFSLKRLRLSRRVESPVFAGTPFSVTLELTNPTRRNQRALRVEEPTTEGRARWFVPLLKSGETERRRSLHVVPCRGRHLWPQMQLNTGYPFGLFHRTLRQAAREATIVLPRLGRLHVGRLRRLLQHKPHLVHATQRPRRRHPVAQTDFYGLREFRPGDSPRWIHWRTTARVGELMVREFEEPPLDNLAVIVEAWLPEQPEVLSAKLDQVRRANQSLITRLLASGPPPPPEKRRAKEEALAKKEEPLRLPLENLETALSLAATILWAWHRQPGAELALAVLDERLGVSIGDNGSRPIVSLFEFLAQAEGGPQGNVEALVARLEAYPVPAGPVLLVTTHPSGLADRLAAALGRHVAVLDVSQPACRDLFDFEPPSPVG